MKLTKHGKVSASLTDFKADLSVIGAFRIMEDAITEFMGDLKIDGLTAKNKYNAIWVFTKTGVKFLKNIAWNSEYTVTCFISKISHIILNIDVALKDATGKLCAYSRTEICALDMVTGKIRKVSTVGVDDGFKTEAPLIDISFTRIDADDLPIAGKVKVGYTSIDYAVHTNNKEYVRFMLDTYPVCEMAINPISQMEIVYVNQSFENDELTVRKGSYGDKDVFVIQKEDKTIAKGEILHGEAGRG